MYLPKRVRAKMRKRFSRTEIAARLAVCCIVMISICLIAVNLFCLCV